MATREKLSVLLSGYYFPEARLAYNEEWDKTADLQSDSKVENDE